MFSRTIVSVFNQKDTEIQRMVDVLWCFAYDADSAKVIRWYEVKMPILCTDPLMAETIRAWVNDIIEVAKCHALALKHACVELGLIQKN